MIPALSSTRRSKSLLRTTVDLKAADLTANKRHTRYMRASSVANMMVNGKLTAHTLATQYGVVLGPCTTHNPQPTTHHTVMAMHSLPPPHCLVCMNDAR